MKHNNVVILITTIILSIMMLLFAVMLIFIGNHYQQNASDSEEQSEAFSGVTENLISETEPIAESNPDDQIFLSDQINLSLDDTAVRDVKIENTYINSVELLPSIRDQHEMVLKKYISTNNFTKSFAGSQTASIKMDEVPEVAGEASVTIPSEITLYNNDVADSGTYDLVAQINGDTSAIKSIGWSSADSSIIKLSNTSGYRTEVSRAKDYVGRISVEMIVTYYTAKSATATEAFDISVQVQNMSDDKIALYDKNGVQLFTDKDGVNVAHLSDYSLYDRFYGAIKTTGWQEINGKKYYYNYDSLPVTGIQYISGIQYEFDQDGTLISDVGEKGIDVSLYQKNIDWGQVASSGITFAIIRCGFRGSNTGKLVEDKCFRQNIEGAKAAGIRVGVYFFTQALNEQEANEEAEMVIQLCDKYVLDLPVFIDSEDAIGGRANGLDRNTRTELIEVFCDTMAEAGYLPGVYASKSWFYDRVNAEMLEKYIIWVAQYNNECDYTGKKNYWQYSSQERINGIEGNVDVDIIY